MCAHVCLIQEQQKLTIEFPDYHLSWIIKGIFVLAAKDEERFSGKQQVTRLSEEEINDFW